MLCIAIHISVHIVISVVVSTVGICNSQNYDICKSLTSNVEPQEIQHVIDLMWVIRINKLHEQTILSHILKNST